MATYPLPQQAVYLTPKSELRFIYGHTKGVVIRLGEHVGSGGAPCYAEMNELLGKHTAVLGSTGAGKSGAVAAIIHEILNRGTDANYPNWKPRIVILDPHNEYSAAFPAALQAVYGRRDTSASLLAPKFSGIGRPSYRKDRVRRNIASKYC